jgi:hypothetical protein
MPKGIAHGSEYPTGTLSGSIKAVHSGTRVLYPDGRMKQAQSEATRYHSASRWLSAEAIVLRNRQRTDRPYRPGLQELEHSNVWSLGQAFVGLLAALWFVLVLPFRLVFWVIAWLGRLTAVILGFSLMVVGMALWASPLFFIGIPLFLIGLVLTLRCLD